ncbi:YchJ family protein [Azomonas agilis]|nr:YchJ family protein [Azomonas agilis]
MSEIPCPCGQPLLLTQCCGLLHAGQTAASAELLMRSRYTAYVLGNVDYLIRTTLPIQQSALDLEAIRTWSQTSQWLGLQVESVQKLGEQHARISFRVNWMDAQGNSHQHAETSLFVHLAQGWFFIDPSYPLKASRNDPCPCNSGQKFKKCCAPYL